MIKLSEYLDVFIENLLKSRLFDFLLLNSIIFREDYQRSGCRYSKCQAGKAYAKCCPIYFISAKQVWLN
jgi:hypothetical protein